MNENSYSDKEDHKIKSEQTKVKCSSENKSSVMSKEMKSKYGVSYANKSFVLVKQHPLSKRKSAPSGNHLTNASAKVVLFERNVEIKDLESKVRYLENKIKELESENRTLQGLQSRQERELKRFKEGVADIPSLLRAHKEEIKTYESTLSGIRKELRDCHREIKLRNEAILKKDSQIGKLNLILKQNERIVQDFSHEIKELKTAKRDLEEENRMLVGANQNQKCENDGLCKKIKDLCNQIQKLEENLSKEKNVNKQLIIDLKDLQLKDEIETLKDSGDEYNLSEKQDNCIPEKVEPHEKISEEFPESKSKKLENSPADESDVEVLQDKQSDDKAKDPLVHTLKCYQEFCDRNLNGIKSVVSSEIKCSKLKSLPPLKQPSREHSQKSYSFISCIPSKKVSPDAEISLKDGDKSFQYGELSKDFQHRLKTDNSERDKPESKRVISKEKMKSNKYE